MKTKKSNGYLVKHFKIQIIILLVGFKVAHAQDVYNFYFQKAPEAQAAIQGAANTGGPLPGPQQSVNSTTSPSSGEASTTKAAMNPSALIQAEQTSKIVDHKRWGLSIGYTHFNFPVEEIYNEEFNGTTIGANYNFNIMFGVHATVSYINVDKRGFNAGFTKYLLPSSVGLTFTPFQVHVANSNLIDFGAEIGSMTYTAITNNQYVGETTKNSGLAYWGPIAGLHFAENLIAFGEYRTSLKSDPVSKNATQYAVGIKYLF